MTTGAQDQQLPVRLVDFPVDLTGGKAKLYVHAAKDIISDAMADPRRIEIFFYANNLFNFADRTAVALDIGAHIGTFTLLACRHFSAVLAFEPGLENRTLLENTLQINGIENVRVLPVALSDRDGEATLYRNFDNFSSQGLAPVEKGSRQSEAGVRVMRLDSMLNQTIPAIGFIKIDTEGHDLKVLAGMHNTIAAQARKPVVQLEFAPNALANNGLDAESLLDFVQSYDYEITVIAQHNLAPTTPETLRRIFQDWKHSLGWVDLALIPRAALRNPPKA